MLKELKKELLKELYDRSMNRIFEMSAEYTMTVPKKGYEEEFNREKEIADMLNRLIEE